jgi:hypothetical protein
MITYISIIKNALKTGNGVAAQQHMFNCPGWEFTAHILSSPRKGVVFDPPEHKHFRVTMAGKDVVFDLDTTSFSSDEFRMYSFKVRDQVNPDLNRSSSLPPTHPWPHMPPSMAEQSSATADGWILLVCPSAGEALPALSPA